MNDDTEKAKLILEYVRLLGEQVIKNGEMNRIEQELGMSHDEIVEAGKRAVLSETKPQDKKVE